MLYTASAFFLEGLKRPLPGMVVMIVANLLNVPLNLILVWGAWGIPAMGAEGSAWATTTVRWMLALSLLAYVWNLGDRALLRIRLPAGQWWRVQPISGGWAMRRAPVWRWKAARSPSWGCSPAWSGRWPWAPIPYPST